VHIYDSSLVFILGGINTDDDFASERFSLSLKTLMVHGEPPCCLNRTGHPKMTKQIRNGKP
jgi:hypothetical protein